MKSRKRYTAEYKAQAVELLSTGKRWDTFGIPEFFGGSFPGWRSWYSLTPRYLLSSLAG